MKKAALAGALALVVTFAISGVGAAAGGQVRLCHFTGDSKTPYVTIEMSASGAYHAHYPHHEDIIPTFTYKGTTYSRNWDAEGKAIWQNGCVPPAPSGRGGGGGGGGGGKKPPRQVKPKAVSGDPSFTG